MKKIILLSFFTCLFNFVDLGTVQANPAIATQPCDTNYWRQMSSKAWMEAEREIMQNQNLIFKPDSVLEYTCFDQFLSVAANQVGEIFVHTDYFGEKIIPYTANESMRNALSNAVGSSLIAYRNGSFNDSFLGGRADNMTIANKNSEFVVPTTNAAYACNTMANVWRAAKCLNFVDNSQFDEDGFFPFETIAGYEGSDPVIGYDALVDTRRYPSRCGPSLGTQGTWADNIAKASNPDTFTTSLKAVYTDVEDRLRSKLSASEIAASPSNASHCVNPPIPTGVIVYTQGGDANGSHLDGICTNPGCSFTNDSLTSPGSCVPNS